MLSFSVCISVYMFVFMYVCPCVCVRVREREREREREKKRERKRERERERERDVYGSGTYKLCFRSVEKKNTLITVNAIIQRKYERCLSQYSLLCVLESHASIVSIRVISLFVCLRAFSLCIHLIVVSYAYAVMSGYINTINKYLTDTGVLNLMVFIVDIQ